MDLEAAAAALYGDTKTAQEQLTPTAPTAAPTDAATALYGAPREHIEQQPTAAPVDGAPPQVDIPDTIKQMRDADPLRKLFSPQGTYQAVIAPDMFTDAGNVDPAVRDAAIGELRELAADLALSTADITELRNRVGLVKTEALPPEEAFDRCISRFNDVFGHGAAQAYADARTLIARDPRVGALLDALNLSNDAETAVMLAKQARAMKMRGVL